MIIITSSIIEIEDNEFTFIVILLRRRNSLQVSLYLNHKRDEIFYIKDAIKSISDNQYDIQERIASGECLRCP